jgi:membrane-bound lytic murein transglycosylase D
MVLAAIVIARNPEQYGFSVEPATPPAADEIPLSGPVDLRRVSERAGVPVDEIQKLNPELRRLTTPLRSDGYRLRVPAGTAATVQAFLAEEPPEQHASLQWHTVRKGETIAGIAGKLKVRRSDLAEANYLSVRSRVSPGQKLVIPRAPTTLLAARSERPAPVVARSRPIDASRVVASTLRGPESAAQVQQTYLVKRGDTLYSIARLFRTTVSSLRSWNRLSGDRITPGDRLTVYVAR